MGDNVQENLFRKLLLQLTDVLSEETHHGLVDVLQHWKFMYGIHSEAVTKEVTSELLQDFKDFWQQQSDKLKATKEDFIDKIESVRGKAERLEELLGLEPQACNIHGPLVEIEEQLLLLVENYEHIKYKKLEEYFSLHEKEIELCSVLGFEKPNNEFEASHGESLWVPQPADIIELNERVTQLEQLKETLEYQFEITQKQLRQVMEECEIVPLTKEERFAFYETELPITQMNLSSMEVLVNKYKVKKQEMAAAADNLRDQIRCLSKKMYKNPHETDAFLSSNSGFKQHIIEKLEVRLKELKEERASNFKNLIETCRDVLVELWDRCCYSESQREEFVPFRSTEQTEEVLEMFEEEIKRLELFYNENKKIFSLAKQYEELSERILVLEGQANNKSRLFDNRGGVLLKEEKERTMLQKKVPAIKDSLMTLLFEFKEETNSDFMHFGEPLEQKIEMKENQIAFSKQHIKTPRKAASAENVMMESRLGAQPALGSKQKSAMTPQCRNRMKTTKAETSPESPVGTLVIKEKDLIMNSSRTPCCTVPKIVVTGATTPRIRSRSPAVNKSQNENH